ncbi:effector binding domain-containing protein [Oscillospiraceae bacterium PP1C4]
MAEAEVIILQQAEQKLYGVWAKSNDKTVRKDIIRLSDQYHKAVSKPDGAVLPFFVLSKDYDQKTMNFDLFIGSTTQSSHLECLYLPKGWYAKVTLKPKLGFLWGPSIGEAKRYFYTQWLPSSKYQASNMEYEHHTEKSTGKSPTIDLFFAIEEKTK